MIRVQAVLVVQDGGSEHGSQLCYDLPPVVEPGHVVADQTPYWKQVLDGEFSFKQSA